MCHLTVLQIRLHMLPGDVRTYILTVGLNLHRCTCGHFFFIPPSRPGIYAFMTFTRNQRLGVSEVFDHISQKRSGSVDIFKNHVKFPVLLLFFSFFLPRRRRSNAPKPWITFIFFWSLKSSEVIERLFHYVCRFCTGTLPSRDTGEKSALM